MQETIPEEHNKEHKYPILISHLSLPLKVYLLLTQNVVSFIIFCLNFNTFK